MNMWMTESLCCTLEANTTLYINYTPVEFFFKVSSSYFQYSGRWVIEDPAEIYVGECSAYVLLWGFYSFWSYI